MTVKQVAITGAGRGIGRSISERFLAEGWRVWALARQQSSLEGLKGDVHFVPFDAAEFLRQHPQWNWQDGYLQSRPAQPWTFFGGEEPA